MSPIHSAWWDGRWVWDVGWRSGDGGCRVWRMKVTLIHTSASLTPLFEGLCAAWLPGVEVSHVVDESLIRDTVAAGRLEEPVVRRVVGLVDEAGREGRMRSW